jgi:hypothetical protein
MSIFFGHSDIDRRSLVWNFEGGEVVSPVGCIVSKVSGLNLATPDARHRRPLKFFSENRGAKFLKKTSEALLSLSAMIPTAA